MKAELGNLEALKKEAHRTFLGQLARRITEAFDKVAGSRGLSPAEREFQQLCRDRFALFDPTCEMQIGFALELRELSLVCESKPSPSVPTRLGEPDLSEDQLMSEFFRERNAERHRVSFRRTANAAEPRPRRPEPRRRHEWGRYLGRWRGLQADDDGDPCRRGVAIARSPRRGTSGQRSRPCLRRSGATCRN